MTDKKTITIAEAVERMITAVNIVTGDDGTRSKRAVVTFIELLKMNKKDYAKQQKFYGLRSIANHRKPIKAQQDARLGLRFTCKRMQDRI